MNDPPTPEKLNRLASHIETMVDELSKNNTITVHERIDQSWYMQKAEELKLLLQQLHDAKNKLDNVSHRAGIHYHEIYCSWQRDIRWLKKYNRDVPD